MADGKLYCSSSLYPEAILTFNLGLAMAITAHSYTTSRKPALLGRCTIVLSPQRSLCTVMVGIMVAITVLVYLAVVRLNSTHVGTICITFHGLADR